MNLMLSMRGEPDQLPFLPEIAALGAGVELGSYGLAGIRSARDWQARLTLHQAVRAQFAGPLAIHGPFLSMEFGHIDHLIRDAVQQRLDMTFDAAVQLSAGRVVLHTGCKPEIELFQLQDAWLATSIAYWQQEIHRWAAAGITIVLENDTEKLPDLMIRLVDAVDNPALGLCLDTGHQHLFSDLPLRDWVRRMAPRLRHIHLHDNDRSRDAHWPLGRGTIDFGTFFAALSEYAPDVTLVVEVEDAMPVKLANLRMLAAHFVDV